MDGKGEGWGEVVGVKKDRCLIYKMVKLKEGSEAI